MKEDNTINIDELVQDAHNFNKGTEEGQKLMEKSFKELGAGRSILVDKDGKIIAGNKSQLAAQAAGIKKVRVIESDGTELIAVKRTDLSIDSAEGRKLALADNLTTQVNLAWDEIQLQSVQDELGAEFDLEEWGAKNLIPEKIANKEVEEDDFDETSDKVETICKTGDVWQLGEHRMMCGDSTKESDVKCLMNGELADLWLTDPPYNVNYSDAKRDILKARGCDFKHEDIRNDNLTDSDFDKFLHDAFSSSVSVLKNGGSFYVWTPQGHTLLQFGIALDSVGLKYKQQIQWVKSSIVLGRSDYQYKHEPCFYGWKDGAAHYFINVRNETTVIEDEAEIDPKKMKKDELVSLCTRLLEERQKEETSIIRCDKPSKSELHPTMKPVKLFGRLIRNSSRNGEIVIDTFGGSGTTIIACEQLGRKARIMELDPHYCDVIIARWEKFTGKKAIKI